MLKIILNSVPFSYLRGRGCLYIDKTPCLEKLVKSDNTSFFLSRPRRFGKSLLISTLESVFKGEADLFDGLRLNRSNFDFPTYPILKFDMSTCPSDNPTRLEYTIYDQIVKQAKNKFDLTVEDDDKYPAAVLTDLTQALKRTSGQPTVILVDEYDAPIIAKANDIPAARLNIKVLHGFYSAIKALNQDGLIRFAFVTGVSKFSMTSIFSGANDFNDISEDKLFANICGITMAEFEANLAAPLAEMFADGLFASSGYPDFTSFRDALISMYDGYSWNGVERVFNPYSLLRAISALELDQYWYASGTPSFLIKFLKSEPTKALRFDKIKLSKALLKAQIVENLSLTPLLYQTGYLTLAAPPSGDSYELKIPNQEVRAAYESFAISTILADKLGNLDDFGFLLINAFDAPNPVALKDLLTKIVRSLPLTPSELNERTFRLALCVILKVVGIDKIDSERTVEYIVGDELRHGRLDLFFKLNDDRKGILIELKHLKLDPTKSEDALYKLLETSLTEGEKQIDKYYPQLLEEVEEIQGIVMTVCWGRGVEVKICEKLVRGLK
ncbi:MAG: ATP-binding protein [Deltaproteobacteria bacterium]|jgi:hypothetical protein|nr:ATP-binding protein [Deltaproteobacteria bacterium]